MGGGDAFRRHEGAWGERKGIFHWRGGGTEGKAAAKEEKEGRRVNAGAASGRGGGSPACGGREVARVKMRGISRMFAVGVEEGTVVGVKLKSPPHSPAAGGRKGTRLGF